MSATIPFTLMDSADEKLMEELLAVVEDVARRSAFTLGPEVESFEQEFAAFCGTEHAVGTSSGTEALVLALRAMNIGPGDEVLVPANSFIATAEAVSLAGATPRFVDVRADTQLVDVELIEAALTPRVRAAIPVHLYGRTADIEPIVALGRERGFRVIEDAAQAHGARSSGRRAGALADCGCFSFYPSKNLGAWGDAGAITTDDPLLADQLRLLRSHGERPRYQHRVVGTTGRLDGLQAAVLRVKLRRLEGWTAARRRHANHLTSLLEQTRLTPPAAATPDGDHVFHLYVVRTTERDALREHLAGLGIATAIHYPVAIHRSLAYAEGSEVSLPVAEALAREVCTLPMHPTITDQELEAIARACAGFESTRRGHRHAA